MCCSMPMTFHSLVGVSSKRFCGFLFSYTYHVTSDLKLEAFTIAFQTKQNRIKSAERINVFVVLFVTLIFIKLSSVVSLLK